MAYKPKLIELSLEELINHIRVKAGSFNGGDSDCQLDAIGEAACGVWADGEDGAGGGSWGHMCAEIGPLLGCNDTGEWYCGALLPILR